MYIYIVGNTARVPRSAAASGRRAVSGAIYIYIYVCMYVYMYVYIL